MSQDREPTRTYPWDGARDPAVDLVRGVAVVCMVIAHVRVWAPLDSEVVKIAITLVNNVASPLFALVMGISAGIVLTRRDAPVRGWVFLARNVVRGLLLVAIGLGLQELETFVAIVLMSLGATLVVAAPFALLPVRVLGAVTVLVFAVGPSVNAAARAAFAPERVYSPALVDQVLQWFVLSTHYRVVSLLPFVLAGVVLARLRLTARVAAGTLAVGLVAGLAVVALRVSGRGLGVSEVVSGDVPDALLDVALAGCACGAVILLARWSPAQPLVTALAPVRAVGALALTAYALHVGLIALVQRTTAPMTPYESWPLYAGGVLAVTVLACWAWWQLLGKGPLERVMGLVTDRIG